MADRMTPSATTIEPVVETRLQRLTAPFEYPVCFTRDLFHPEHPLLADTMNRLNENRRHRTLCFVDDGVLKATPGLDRRIVEYARAHDDVVDLRAEPVSVPGGEKEKNGWPAVDRILQTIGRHALCRQSFIWAVGGGSMLDIVGLAASLVHRGLRLIRIPTTVLAQNDAGVGVKNGVDAFGQKNFLGTFAPPFAVLNDDQFIETLPWAYYIGGVAEAFKVALIEDADFFYTLEREAEALRRRDRAATETMIRRGAVLHLDHIREGGDPFETGSARPLDFGHWSAHKLEALSHYEVGHGRAVAIGIALDVYGAAELGLLSERARDRIHNALSAVGLPLWHALLEARDPRGGLSIVRGLEEFRAHLGGQLTLTLPDGIGHKKDIHELPEAIIERGILFLKNRVSEN